MKAIQVINPKPGELIIDHRNRTYIIIDTEETDQSSIDLYQDDFFSPLELIYCRNLKTGSDNWVEIGTFYDSKIIRLNGKLEDLFKRTP